MEGTIKYMRTAVKSRVSLLPGKFLNMFLECDIGPGWLSIVLHYFSWWQILGGTGEVKWVELPIPDKQT